MVIIPKRFLFTKQKEPNAAFKIERIVKRKYKRGKKVKKDCSIPWPSGGRQKVQTWPIFFTLRRRQISRQIQSKC